MPDGGKSEMGGVSHDRSGVIAPPPVLFALAFSAGAALDFFWLRGQTGMPAPSRYGLAFVLLAAAVALMAGAFHRLWRAGTRAGTWHPTTVVIADGVYRYSRNPMYLAATLVYLAAALAVDSVMALVFVIPLLIVLHYGVIVREERYLEEKFGDNYLSYKQSVRRWI